MKVKISPGAAVERVTAVKEEFPNVSVWVDANGSYNWNSLNDRRELQTLAAAGLEAIEQPFARGRELDVREMQEALQLRALLDESISGPNLGAQLVEQNCAAGLVIKLANIGGLRDAVRLAKSARRSGRRF